MKAKHQHEPAVSAHAVCRTPLFPLETTLIEAWPTLKRLIRDSSPEFYPIIAQLEANDLAGQPEKVRFTIWKYFNRSRYRATPFGEFAAVSVIPFQDDKATISLQHQMQVLSWPDWKRANKIPYDSASLISANFRTSPLCYAYGQEYHYLYRSENQFELNAIGQRKDIDLIVEHCQTLRSFQSIAAVAREQLGMKKHSLIALLKQLLQLQVLTCDLQANITGQDYFQRMELKPEGDQLSYKIASRPTISGGLDRSVAADLEAYADFVSRCIQVSENPQLEQFKNAFLQCWEQRSVPLALALNPILGIGYGNASDPLQPGLVGELQHRSHQQEIPRIAYGKFEQFLLNQLIKDGAIQLSYYCPTSSAPPLPNTGSILFHLYQGHPVIHHAGGPTATALLGRFTPVREIHSISLALTEVEQAANPDAIFFDLAYQFEGRTDNVNRRRKLYVTELPIGSWSTFDAPLRLDEIMVSIRDGQIMLHHVNGARLIPRLASAYNHSRSDLDLFRFLCDVQYQGIQTQLSLDLQQLFPHLDHYPRVYYQHIIACPAKWKLPKCGSMDELLQWLEQKQLKQPFTIGRGDQTLTIDPSSPEDLQYLMVYQRQHAGDSYVSEALIDQTATVHNADGKRFHAQFITAVVHHKEIYPSPSRQVISTLSRDLRLPGTDWCYLELYMRPELMDGFLLNEVATLINQQKALIREWFYIRYNQPSPHLRLRLKLYDAGQLPTILQSIHQLMDISKHYGPLKRMEIKAYEREIMRYGKQQMDKVEYFFYLDSRWALKQLRYSVTDLYGQIITFAEKLCEVVFGDLKDQQLFYSRLAENFASEMGFVQVDFKRINHAYQDQKTSKSTNGQLVKYFGRLIGRYAPERRSALLADLIHMHVNRRFSGVPRMHEAVIYQFLHKRSLSRHHQQKRAVKIN